MVHEELLFLRLQYEHRISLTPNDSIDILILSNAIIGRQSELISACYFYLFPCQQQQHVSIVSMVTTYDFRDAFGDELRLIDFGSG
jgi:hypothetical protein